MRSIQQANQGQAPIGIKQIDTQIQKVKSELKVEHSQAFERTMREAKINKDTAQILSQRLEKVQEEKDKYKKQADEILKRTEGPGIQRSSIHSNRSQKIDNDKFTQEQIKQREILALELEMNQKEKQFLAEIENLKMDIKQLTHDLNEAWSENDQKDKQIEQLQTQNSLLLKENQELQKKLFEEKAIQKKQQSPQKIVEPQNNLINENSALIESLKKQINELQEEISEYEETINSHQQEISDWKNKYSQLQKNKDEIDNYYAIAYNKIENLLELKEEMENQRKDDQNKINELEATIIVLRNNLNERDNENKRLQDQIDTIQKNNQDLRAENLKLFEQLASKPLEVNLNLQNDLIELCNAPSNGGEEYISQFNKLSDDFSNLKSKYTEVLEQKQTLEDENNKKTKENSLLNDTIKKLENRVKSQDGEIQDWINKYNSKNIELNAILEQENNDKLKIEELELHIKDQEIKINDLEIALKYQQKDSTPRNKDNNTVKQRELEDKLKQANVQINDLKKEIQSLQQQQNKQDEQDLQQMLQDLEEQNNKLKLDNDKLISQLHDAEKKISDQDQIINQQKKQQQELEQKQIQKLNPSESNQEQEDLIERLNQNNEQLEAKNLQQMQELNLIKNKNSKNLRSKFILVGKLMQIEKQKSDLEEKLKKQKAIINELLENQKNEKTEKENSSCPIPQVNEPQNEQPAENELDTHQNIKEELVKQKQRNQKLLGKIFRILTQQKQKDAIISQLEERIEKQKAINQELIENQKNSEQQLKLNEEVKDQKEVEPVHEQPQIQDDQKEQKNELLKLKTQNQKLLSKILRIMTKLKIKEDELQNLNERLKKQQAINDAIATEPKEQEEAQSEQEQLIVDDQQNDKQINMDVENKDVDHDQMKIKNQNQRLQGKLFRTMFLLNKKNNEIESLLQRIQKQKAQIEELNNQIHENNINSNQIKEQENEQNFNLQNNQPEQPQQEINSNEIEKQNEVLRNQKINKMAAKLFMIMSKYNKQNKLIENLNERLSKYKAIIESQSQENQQPQAENINPIDEKLENEQPSIEQQTEMQNINEQENVKLRNQNNKLLVKLFRVMSGLTRKNNQIQLLEQRLTKQKAIIDTLTQEQAPNLEVQEQPNLPNKENSNIEPNCELQEQQINHQNEISIWKQKYNKLLAKLFRILSQQKKKDKQLIQLNERINKQKAINDELMLEKILDAQIQLEPELHHQEISLQAVYELNPEKQSEIRNNNEFLKIKNQNAKALSKLFRLSFLLQKQNKENKQLNDRLVKQNAIIEEFSKIQNSSHQLKLKNGKLLAKLFILTSNLKMQNKANEDLQRKLLQKNAQLQQLVENPQYEEKNSQMDILQQQPEQKEEHQDQHQNENQNSKLEIQRLENQNKKYLAKIFKLLCQMFQKDRENDQLLKRLSKQKAIVQDLIDNQNYYEQTDEGVENIEPQQVETDTITQKDLQKLQKVNAKMLAKQFKLLFTIKKLENQLENALQRLQKQKEINLQSLIKIDEQEINLEQLQQQIQVLQNELEQQDKFNHCKESSEKQDVETNQDDYYKNKYNNLLEEHLHLLNVGDLINEQEKQLRKEFRQQLEEEKLKAKDLFNNLLNEHMKLQEECEKAIDALNSINQNQEQLVDKNELETIKNKFNSLLSEHLALEELNDGLNKKQDDIKKDHEKQLDEEIQKQKEKYNKLLNQYLILEMQRDGILQEQSPKLENQLDLDRDDDVVEKKQENTNQDIEKEKEYSDNQQNQEQMKSLQEQLNYLENQNKQLKHELENMKNLLETTSQHESQQIEQTQPTTEPQKMEANSEDYYKNKYNNLLEEHLHLLNVGDLINEQEKQLRKEFRQQLEEEKLKAKDLFNNLLNEHMKLQEECENAIDALNSVNQNQEQLVDKNELETIKNKFNSLLSEHLALEELNDGLNKKQDDIKKDHEKQLDEEIQKQKEKYNKLLNQYLLLEMQRDGILQEQSPKLENQLDLDQDDDVVEKKQESKKVDKYNEQSDNQQHQEQMKSLQEQLNYSENQNKQLKHELELIKLSNNSRQQIENIEKDVKEPILQSQNEEKNDESSEDYYKKKYNNLLEEHLHLLNVGDLINEQEKQLRKEFRQQLEEEKLKAKDLFNNLLNEHMKLQEECEKAIDALNSVNQNQEQLVDKGELETIKNKFNSLLSEHLALEELNDGLNKKQDDIKKDHEKQLDEEIQKQKEKYNKLLNQYLLLEMQRDGILQEQSPKLENQLDLDKDDDVVEKKQENTNQDIEKEKEYSDNQQNQEQMKSLQEQLNYLENQNKQLKHELENMKNLLETTSQHESQQIEQTQPTTEPQKMEANSEDYYKNKYNNLLEEHLHLLNVGDLINEQEKQLRKEFRQQLEEEKLKAKDLFNNLLNEHMKLQEECENAIDALNSVNQNQEQLVDKNELETIKNKFNSLLSEHLALEELNDGLNKKQDDIKKDHEKQLDEEIQKQKEKYNKLLNQYLLLEMQRDGILQEQSPKLENQLDLDRDDDVVEKKQQVHHLNTDEQQINLFGAQGDENSPQLEEIQNYKQQLSDLQSQILSLNEEKNQLQKLNLQLAEQLITLPNSTNKQSQESFNKENDIIEKQGLELAHQRQELLAAQEYQRNQETFIGKLEKDKELLENECNQLKTQVDDLQSKLENQEQKLSEKTAQFVQTMEQLLKENQDDFEENKQLVLLNQATQPVIQILKKLQHDQEQKQSRKQSQELQSTQENQKEIIQLKHYIKTLEDSKQQYSDGISVLNRRLIELFNKNSLLQTQIQQLNQQRYLSSNIQQLDELIEFKESCKVSLLFQYIIIINFISSRINQEFKEVYAIFLNTLLTSLQF